MPRSIARTLPILQDAALKTMTSRSPCPVATYALIRRSVASSDLLDEHAEPVRRRFNAYYGVRRNAVWRAQFYARFEAAKTSSLGSHDLFREVLRGLHDDTGRVEASFVSKLVATLRPDGPIIDSVVRGWLARHITPPPFPGGLVVATEYHRWLEGVMTELLASPEARAWSEVFTTAFPVGPGDEAVPAMKRLDFLIWAGAER